MFSKYVVALLFFAASAIAGVVHPGIYQILNVASHSTARAQFAPGPVIVSSTREHIGDFALWNIQNAQDGGYTIENLALDRLLMLDTFAAVLSFNNGEPVFTNRNPTVWDIEPAGNGEFVIKLQAYDLLWNAEPPVVPRGDVKLRPSRGFPTQHWRLVPVNAPHVEDYDYDYDNDRWDLPEGAPGRLSGQI
ncbi:hypothetical protein BYT27DRAFT_7148188 [Phlegmacium glaucopus]|nr:hypothetical protein BYT27DRAFT_7148188 [Phlegmacium glaucopus]